MVDVFFSGKGQWYTQVDKDSSGSISPVYQASGVFSLTKEDERTYRHTKSFEGLDVAILLPSVHPDSEFLRKKGGGGITNCGTDDVYFCLETEQPKPIILKLRSHAK